MFKKMAGFFAHPEQPVETDGFSCGRNVFSQPWAAETLDEDAEDERDQILADAKALKTMAGYFQHPERELEMDTTASARNYFSQPWSAEQETFGDAEARALAIAETKALKKMATLYQHPEAPLEVDATAFGRNYFTRATGEDQMSAEEEQERALVLADAMALKKLAAVFMHPEAPLQLDGAVFGRNYYSRASAEDPEEDEMSDEREIILEEMKELKQAATDFMHPELAIAMDSAASGRNYFSRASAEDQEEDEFGDEREIILEEMKELKEAAFLYRHPEAPLKVDPTCFGRNYYGRDSADEQEASERATILEEMKQLKQAAIMYRHPEAPLDVDSICFGRNYYGRASAEEQEDDELGDERAIVLEEMKELKQAATDFMHPELPFSMGMSSRNYFGRASAPEQESFEEAEERARVLAEASSLKKLAVDFAHPELPLATADGTASARNFFSRPSAPGDSFEEAEARDQILEDAALLKKVAAGYLHPERPVEASPSACARSFFSRASAPEQASVDEEFERTAILAEASALKKLAVDFLHPERSVEVSSTACGRNYFARPSALGVSEHITSSGYENHTEEYHSHAEERSLHDDYGHFDMDEDIFSDMRQTIVLPADSHMPAAPKMQSKQISSDEEGELSRSPSSIMLFTGACLDDADHPPLPTMG